ncbi:MAG: tetratricopeptide repeat protein [Caldilineaceae bacterium]|nr:tetratricopeptide repeat protein [Caldilineaceae bacterium]
MLTVRLLGQFTLTLDGETVELPSRPAQSLLAWLVLHPGIDHRREQLAGIFWPDATEENARNNLRHALWRLRRAVPEELLHTDKIAIRWIADGKWEVDTGALTAGPAQADRADDLLPSLQAYGGELLPGFYDEWVFPARDRLAALYDQRIGRLLALLLAEQRWQEAIQWAERWIAQGHTPEAAYGALMTAHASLGDRAPALAAFQRCVEALDQELGVPPSPETVALADAIRTGQFLGKMTGRQGDKATSTLPPHLVTLSPPHPFILSNLPAPTTPLIGRENELAQLATLLTAPDHRLVTILGPGGMGKSSLALAVGRAGLPHFADGVFWLELTALTSAEELPRAIGDSLGYPFQNDPRPLRQQLIGYLAGRQLLLLLDNFEHLLDGAELLIALLEAAPGLHLLVTSRERLRLHAEALFRLDGLACPIERTFNQHSPDEYGALHLFVQSVRRTIQDYTPGADQWPAIVRICRMVNGMPLGILLAASWVEHLPPAEIADAIAANVAFLGQDLRDLDPRHRRIEAVFEQSWQRLSADEQQALMGLSIFAGGFDRAAAKAVAGAPLPTLTRLVDKALLWRVGEGRYDLHELIRQWVRQKLVKTGREQATLALRSRWFLGLVSGQEARLKGAEQNQAIEWMAQEQENVRAAWFWAVEAKEVGPLQEAVEALGIFYNRPGYWEAGEGWMERTASGLGEPVTPQAALLQSWVFAWLGLFLHRVGKLTAAQERMAQALALVADSPLPLREIALLRGFVHLHRAGDLMTNRRRESKIADLRQALAIYSQLEDDWWTVHTLIPLGHSEIFNGSIRAAMEKLQEALRLARRSGNRAGEMQALQSMSFAAEQMGQVAEGEDLARQALATIDDPAQQQPALSRLAFVLLARGKFAESVAVSQRAIEWAKNSAGGPRDLAFTFNNLARGYLDLGRFAEAGEIAQQNVNRWKETYGWEQPFLLRPVAMAALALGDAQEARRLIEQTVESQQQMGNENLFALSGAYVDCAYPALALADWDAARRMLVAGLDTTQRCQAHHYACLALPAVALLFAMQAQWEKAAFVNGAIQCHPCLTGSRWYATVALDRLAELLAPLSPDVRSAAEARGRAMALPELTDELLARLS